MVKEYTKEYNGETTIYLELRPKKMETGEEVTLTIVSKDNENESQYGISTVFTIKHNGIEKRMWVNNNVKYSKLFFNNIGKTITVKKVMKTMVKTGNPYFTLELVGETSPSSSGLSLPSEFIWGTLVDGTKKPSEKEAVKMIQSSPDKDNINTFITMWKTYGSNEKRAKEVYEHRGEVQ